MKLKLRVDAVTGEHVHLSLFAGQDTERMAGIGSLCVNIGEYQMLGLVLTVGAEEISRRGFGGGMTVEHDDAIFRAYRVKSGGDGDTHGP